MGSFATLLRGSIPLHPRDKVGKEEIGPKQNTQQASPLWGLSINGGSNIKGNRICAAIFFCFCFAF